MYTHVRHAQPFDYSRTWRWNCARCTPRASNIDGLDGVCSVCGGGGASHFARDNARDKSRAAPSHGERSSEMRAWAASKRRASDILQFVVFVAD